MMALKDWTEDKAGDNISYYYRIGDTHMFYYLNVFLFDNKWIVQSGIDGSEHIMKKRDIYRTFKNKSLALKFAEIYMKKHNIITSDEISYWE